MHQLNIFSSPATLTGSEEKKTGPSRFIEDFLTELTELSKFRIYNGAYSQFTRIIQRLYRNHTPIIHLVYTDHTLNEQAVYTEYTLGIHPGRKATRQKFGVRSWNAKAQKTE